MTSNEALSPVIAEFNGVSFRYKGNTDVLKDIHFSLAPGSFHFMTGESGAGKTSLLGLLYLDHLPTKGREKLSAGGYKMTPQRKEILKIFVEHSE